MASPSYMFVAANTGFCTLTFTNYDKFSCEHGSFQAISLLYFVFINCARKETEKKSSENGGHISLLFYIILSAYKN